MALLLLLSVTLLSHLASTEVNTIGHRSSRFTAQIAHHTELPYIWDPPEPSNNVDGPLPDEVEAPATPPTDGKVFASSAEHQTNNEDNEVHAADGLGAPAPVLLPAPNKKEALAADAPVVRIPLPSVPFVPYDSPSPPLVYNRVHQWYKNSRRPVYAVRTFTCTFEDHQCGMRNQKIIGPHFQLVSNSIAGRPGRYMAVDAQRVPVGVSRLITPYLPGHRNALVCLQLRYVVHGPGAERIQVVAQDKGNRPLFSLERHPEYAWRTYATNMTVQQDLRFFIEAYTNRQPGMIAIDDFTYSFDPCR